tara:strand:- start:324 stop:662 length:339 start_codon:yes stop_codon:yes gene_type:complete
MSPEDKIRNYFKKSEKGVKFYRNKKYFSCLREEKEGNYDVWVCDNPLFVSDNKGLYPIYRTGGRHGVMNKNYHEFLLKDLPDDFNKEIKLKKQDLPKTTRNILKFKAEDLDI